MSHPPLSEQIVVLTGATSGIGLATARRLAAAGATLVPVARNTEALEDLSREIVAAGGACTPVTADVGERAEVERVAAEAVTRHGRIDTWINDAGVAIYGAITEIDIADQRRLFETNYWGVVYGSLAAIGVFRSQRNGGRLITVGSVLSDRAMIYQGPYSASKHAVKGFTDALRMELAAAREPISVTLIKPGPIDTPYMEHARSTFDTPGTKNPPPSYHPDVVAKAIAHACEHDVRELVVGGGGWLASAAGTVAPGLTDVVMELTGKMLQGARKPPRPGMRDNLYEPREDGSERSSLPGPVRRSSLLLEAQMNPALAAGAATLGLACLLVLASRRR